ncbi:hypothetical protein DSO57_1007739 [Entomophthora muscae]|uniref:Uncharacterized protein n=1 Tax=Entomophthora muscae TaxID=34485 RepID=A0ACC2TI16_9FUNG|nr:hypothetical protein DSO57_1007739 [Entomophthora muscae]
MMKFDIFSTEFYQVFLHGLHSSLGGKVPDPSFGRRKLPHHPDEEMLRKTCAYDWAEGLVSVASSRKRVYLQTWSRQGSAPKAELIMLHGIAAYGGCLAKLVPGYTAAGLRVHLMDLPGHGRSDGVHADAASMQRLIRALHGVVQHVKRTHGGPIYLMGYSLGGLVAIRYCLEHPKDVSGLSLISPCVKLNPAVLRDSSLITLARMIAFLTPRLALPSPHVDSV